MCRASHGASKTSVIYQKTEAAWKLLVGSGLRVNVWEAAQSEARSTSAGLPERGRLILKGLTHLMTAGYITDYVPQKIIRRRLMCYVLWERRLSPPQCC